MSRPGDKRMHEDNIYRHYRPDFADLARLYPDKLGDYVVFLDEEKTDAVIDWEDPEAARALTKTLLHHDFKLEWDIPIDRLCPPVPNRLNYICWLHDLLELRTGPLDNKAVWGLDVGTGASCIYPLLGHRVYGWNFMGSDIDSIAIKSASANVERNKLAACIEIKHVARRDYSGSSLESDEPGPVLEALSGSDRALEFTMCNPPFFSSLEDIGQNAPHGCVDELITAGGELAFVTAMVRDSLQLRDRVRWYTTMVGKKVTLRRVLGVLREAGIHNVRTTEFLQGRTTRWGVGWSFSTDGLAELQGADSSAHKIFGRRKLDKRREAVHSFVVHPQNQEEVLDEAVVVQRVVDFFKETKQVNVVGVTSAAGGAEDLYRQVVLAELSSGDEKGAEAEKGVGTRVEVVAPSDPRWKSRCTLLVTVVAGASGDEDHQHEHITPGQQGGGSSGAHGGGGHGHEHSIKVVVEMTSGGDRGSFWKAAEMMAGEVGRTNRRWRRKRAPEGGAEPPAKKGKVE